MKKKLNVGRRGFLTKIAQAAMGTVATSTIGRRVEAQNSLPRSEGAQRLSIDKLKEWESWGYGMFIHFGLSTYSGWLNYHERKSGKFQASSVAAYHPDRLDVDQWVSVARDAGMKYIVLTAKHEYGHCLWPSRHTDYTVANSPNKTDVVEKLVKACEKRGVRPGLYYSASDLYHRFGSLPRPDAKRAFIRSFPKTQEEDLPPYTTSVYQTFMTAQLKELLTQYGTIDEVWIDLPGELGWGYRTFLYNYIAALQPQTFIAMNKGTPDSTQYDYHYSFPSDLLTIEQGLPPADGYRKWRTVENKGYYMPGEVCDSIGKNWFYTPSDPPRSNLVEQYVACRRRGANMLLNVPPNKHGIIDSEYIQALMNLRKDAGM
ncbi:MAG: alpha-L-fucosidase [Chitinophagaceae bacterium]|nr:alpha-L-fucosidase [Chitinophagaceae bacterium]